MPDVIAQETHVVIELHEGPVTVVTECQQGPPGAKGDPGDAPTMLVGSTPLSGHSAVAVDADGVLVQADCTIAAHRSAVLGVIKSAAMPGESVTVRTGYPLEHAGWTWTPGSPIFVGLAGALTQIVPAQALFAQVVGQALSPTRILVDVRPPVAI